MVKHPNINNKSPLTSTVNNYPDNCNNKHSNITIIPYSNDSVALASNDSRQSHATNPLVLTSPNMSYTGTGANPTERSLGSQVGQRIYPRESVASVRTAATAELTTLQSNEWDARAEYGVPMDEPTEQPALHYRQQSERRAQVTPCANGRSALLQKRILTSDHESN